MKTAKVWEYFGSRNKAAKALTLAGYPIGRTALSTWGETVPELRAWQIEEITGGRLKRERRGARITFEPWQAPARTARRKVASA